MKAIKIELFCQAPVEMVPSPELLINIEFMLGRVLRDWFDIELQTIRVGRE